MPCSTFPYLLLHGPLCLLGIAELPHGLFLVGSRFLFTEGGGSEAGWLPISLH